MERGVIGGRSLEKSSGSFFKGGVFAFLEITVAISLILGLAALVYPVVQDGLEERRRQQAEEECRRLAALVATRPLRSGLVPGEDTAYLVGPGVLPEGHARLRPGGQPGSLEAALEPAPARTPVQLRPDPWGRAYVLVPVDPEEPGRGGAVLSAGPDGVIQTTFGLGRFRGDDVGVRLPAR